MSEPVYIILLVDNDFDETTDIRAYIGNTRIHVYKRERMEYPRLVSCPCCGVAMIYSDATSRGECDLCGRSYYMGEWGHWHDGITGIRLGDDD